MASTSSFSWPGPTSVGKFTMTIDDLKAFHTIDRGLYARLVLELGRGLNDSMHALAFWLWLERSNVTMVYVVQEMLVLPDPIVNLLAEEAALCLKSITTEPLHFPAHGFPDDQIPLTQNLTRTNITLNFLHYNRDAAILGITRTIEDVCLRVIDDIVQRAAHVTAVARERDEYYHHQHQEGKYLFWSGNINDIGGEGGGRKEQVEAAFSYLSPKEGVDDRTIFLTFSRGYRIRDDEVRDFLTRKFGECIESIQMQEVAAGEQPLYARLVLRSVGAMRVILEGKEKAKFAINGKHVWARKYVFNKNNAAAAAGPSNVYWTPSGSDASSSSSPSPSHPASSSKSFHLSLN